MSTCIEVQQIKLPFLYRIKSRLIGYKNDLKRKFKFWLFRKLFHKENSNLIKHAIYEMKLVGLNKPDSDYSGGLYYSVLDLMFLFSSQGHSGFSDH